MNQNKHINMIMQPQCHTCQNYSGYFGKPTKLRESQPSMFQILTWNDSQIQKKYQQQSLPIYCTSCKSYLKNQIITKEPIKIIQKQQLQLTANPTNQILKKADHEQTRYRQSPKKIHHHIKHHKDAVITTQQQPKQQPNSPKPKQSHLLPKNKSSDALTKTPSHPSYVPKSPKLTTSKPQQQFEQQPLQTKQKLIQKFKQTTRWIPNSAFTTYFGKPAFENYGRGNTNPTYGGLMYGDYLKSHNVQPHRGMNSPKNVQSYNVALMKGQQFGAIYPYPPKINIKQSIAKENKNYLSSSTQSSCQIYQQENHQKSLPIFPPNLYNLEKFGGKGIQKIAHNTSKLQHSNMEKQNQYLQPINQNHQKKQVIYQHANFKKYTLN